MNNSYCIEVEVVGSRKPLLIPIDREYAMEWPKQAQKEGGFWIQKSEGMLFIAWNIVKSIYIPNGNKK